MSLEAAMDVLESLKLAPSASQLWRRLSSLSRKLDADARPALTDQVAALRFQAPVAEWLRLSALANMTRDWRWLARQAALADAASPPDAIMTFLNLAWHHALVRTPDRRDFVRLLRDIDVPRLQQLVAARLPEKAVQPRRPPHVPMRVAIYTPQVASRRHGGTAFTLNVMSVLARAGMELRSFSVQETTVPAADSYHGGDEGVTQLPVDVHSLTLNTPGSVQLMLPDTEFSVRFRFEQVLRAIDAYEPDLVIFVGFMSPLAYCLYRRYPVVGMSIHALPPAAPVDVWLSAEQAGDASCWPTLPAPQVFPFSFRFWPTAPVAAVDRADAGLPADGVVLVTAGYRLHLEIAPPWSAQMIAFLDAHADVHWLLVGVAEGKHPPALPPHPRVHLVPPQAKIEPWLAACDLYVAPPRVGGGGTVAMAMEQGLPVAAFAGTDGGDKVGKWAAGTPADYFAQLEAWVSDPDARRQAGEALKQLFHCRLDLSSEQAVAGLVQACERAIESFDQRMNSADA